MDKGKAIVSFTAVIKEVKLSLLEEEFLGKELTKDLVNKVKNKGIDPCEKNGENHTIVIDGFIFKNKVEINKTCKEILGQFGYLKN